MFQRIYIEISNICNLQCSFCPVVEREKNILELENFKKVLLQVKPLTKEVCLHLMGEPLTHPQIKDILKECDQQNIPVQLTTNGVNIAQKEELLLKCSSLRQLNFSLQSFSDNFPHKSFDDYFWPILNLANRFLKEKPDTYINYRLWNIGRENQAQRQNDHIFDLVENFFNVKLNRSIFVDSIKSKNIKGRLYFHFDSHFDWPSLSLPFQGGKGKCHALSSHIGIHADGTVVPCCLDKEAQIPLGNCLKEDLVNILESDRAQRMREGFSKGLRVETLCQHCSFINRFSS